MKRYSIHEDMQLSALVGVPAESVWATTCCGFWCHVYEQYPDGSIDYTLDKHFKTRAEAEEWGRRQTR